MIRDRDYIWLARWEPLEAPGRHTKAFPAIDAHGYQWNAPERKFDRIPKVPGPTYSMWERVNRAIPVEGTVDSAGHSWDRSPQVRMWMEEPKEKLLRRIKKKMRAWLLA